MKITTAPGRTTVTLEPLAGAGVLAVGLVREGKLEEFVDDPVDVLQLVRVLRRRARRQTLTARGGVITMGPTATVVPTSRRAAGTTTRTR